MSTRREDNVTASDQQRVDLTHDIPLQAASNLGDGLAFLASSFHVGFRPRVSTHARHGDGEVSQATVVAVGVMAPAPRLDVVP
jgi:hypothetical protein